MASLIALLAFTSASRGRADEGRFAVVNLTPEVDSGNLVDAVEKEIARLRPGATPIDEEVLRRMLATNENQAGVATRLLQEALQAQTAGDCATAVSKGNQAEPLILVALSIDDERDLLKQLYQMLVICEDQLGHAAALTTAAMRLRSLVALPPTDLPAALWEKHVAQALPANGTVELQVDSDPPNGQVAINLHGDGVTPHTLKVAPGKVFVEVQKAGYKKAFRTVEITNHPVRVALRLIERAHDRPELAEMQLRVLRQNTLVSRSGTLSRLSQLVRADMLVLLNVTGDRVKITFFDAERGSLTEEPIESAFDRKTGRVAALAARVPPGSTAKPAAAAPTATASVPATTASVPAAADSETASKIPASAFNADTADQKPAEGLPEAKAIQQKAKEPVTIKKPGAPWWSWVIAGVVAASFITFVFTDRVETPNTLVVRASWPAPAR